MVYFLLSQNIHHSADIVATKARIDEHANLIYLIQYEEIPYKYIQCDVRKHFSRFKCFLALTSDYNSPRQCIILNNPFTMEEAPEEQNTLLILEYFKTISINTKIQKYNIILITIVKYIIPDAISIQNQIRLVKIN